MEKNAMSNIKHLDLSALEKAIVCLRDSLAYSESDLARNDAKLALHLKAGSIQAFEFTYELCVKFMRRYLMLSEPSADVIAEMSFPTLIRTGNEKGLLKRDWPTWKNYRDKRNITSHTYSQKKAGEVYSVLPTFLEDASFLLQQLEQRNRSL